MKLRAHMLFLVALSSAAAQLLAANVGLIHINGAIDPAAADYISRAIDLSGERNDACLIIQLDTPGGLLDSTKTIVQKFYSSPVPTVVYVSPSGARAASAGTFITLASDVAAMAPYTRIGAAHPVFGTSLFGGGENTNDVMMKKIENDSATDIENIARKRHRNADWARTAVIDSVVITAEEALKQNVIDLIATNMTDLLKQLDGREVEGRTLKLGDASVDEIPMNTSERFLHTFLRPEVMFALMLVVMYGIIGELSSPGAILPGVAGAIALILFLYMSSILPVNLAGVTLIFLAIVLFVFDIFAPSHGILTFGGIISFFLGALMLFSRAGPAFHLSLAYIIPGTLLTAAFFVFILGAALRAQRRPVLAGAETMLGQVVRAQERIDASSGRVFVEGELWTAVSEIPIEAGKMVEIVGLEGLKLKVKPKEE